MSPSAPHPLNVETHGKLVLTGAVPIIEAPPERALPPQPASVEPPRHAMQHMQHMQHDDSGPNVLIDPGAASPIPAREAVAVLVPTKGSRVSGVVRFRDEGDGLAVTASINGLPGRVHAYHVHVYGDCSAPDAESAGPHFHFHGSSFDKEARIITGDLGELRREDRGTTVHQTRIEASLQGRHSIVGRAIVVHERGNDPQSPPDGAAGKRLACGVIGLTGPAEAPAATAQHHP